jgi:Transglycosylase SLT domain
MARFVVGAVFGIVVGVVAGAAAGLHADDASAEVLEAAASAHVDPVDLAGAVNTVGVDAYTYLRSTGELPPLAVPRDPVVPPPGYSARVDCIIRVESRGDPNARNRSGASGLGQFLPGTWASTPQGKAGLSVFNGAANRAAIAWMLSVGRAREFDAVRFYGC